MLALVDLQAAADELHHLVAPQEGVLSEQFDIGLVGDEFEARALSIKDLAAANGKSVFRPASWPQRVIDADEGGFVKADAKIDGTSIVLSSPEAPHPAQVRFAWNQLAEPNLVNSSNLPAGAFRAGDSPKCST